MEISKIILPVFIVIALYLLVLLVTKKRFIPTGILIKARILVGAVAVGFFISEAVQSQNIREIVTLSLLALIVFYGVITLQNKYLYIKK